MRDDSGAEVLFRPDSSLPEIRPFGKRDSKKRGISFFFVSHFFPSVHAFFSINNDKTTFLIEKREPFDQKKGAKT